MFLNFSSPICEDMIVNNLLLTISTQIIGIQVMIQIKMHDTNIRIKYFSIFNQQVTVHLVFFSYCNSHIMLNICRTHQKAREPDLGTDSLGNLWAHLCKAEESAAQELDMVMS